MVFLLALSVVVTVCGLYPYLKLTAKGIVRPRLVTWGVWFTLAVVMSVSALIEGHMASAVLSLQGVAGCLLVVMLGWRSGSRDISQLDIGCLAGALIGIMALVVLKNPAIALLIAILVDAIAFVPTLHHAWKKPFEEGLACYIGNFSASTLVFSSAIISAAGFMGVVYPIYSITFNLAMAMLIILGRTSLNQALDYPAGPLTSSETIVVESEV